MSAPAPREQTVRLLLDFAAANELDADPGDHPGEVVLVLPGEKKLKTVLSLVVGETDVSASAFVVRNPDENHVEVYRYLLRRNLRIPGLAYAIDAAGDVFVVGRLPLAGLDEATLDRFLGVVLDAADASFNDLLTLGFLTSIKREWAWRTSRGESRRNLAAFAHLMPADDDAAPEVAGEAAAPDAPEARSHPEGAEAPAPTRDPGPPARAVPES